MAKKKSTAQFCSKEEAENQYGALAKTLEAKGFDIGTAIALIMRYGPAIVRLFKQIIDEWDTPVVSKKAAGECPAELAQRLFDTEHALVEALCANTCALHEAGCCEHE